MSDEHIKNQITCMNEKSNYCINKSFKKINNNSCRNSKNV